MDREFDVLGQYRAITSKLKRRFLKKPNVSEASAQFGSLAKELKRQDCPQYAGFCSLAKARCENTLSNATGEVEALIEAARLFLDAEKNSVELRCPVFEEHLTEAIHLFNQAIKTHCAQGNSALGACLCLEIGDALRHMKRPHEAMVHYQHAAELQHQNPIDALQSMTLVASCKIDTGDFDGALSVLTEMAYFAEERGAMSEQQGKLQGPYQEILARCETGRVLLLMLLQPTPQRIRPQHAQILQKYSEEGDITGYPMDYMNKDLFLLLQSVVMVCQLHDVDTLKELEKELWTYLEPEQQHLLHLITSKISNNGE
ncbi:hypothetical protein OS493_027543 [Desmophyllum pertusum]|uniref:Factor VIII intron 22 protein n=1 Tax=Desmophyllum pertusum TaxID=174260 RepID=A0A9W9ZZG2_9CNID|nr:hypothetical protein OS493_027543 [Desmophyllum pertusum]